MYDKALALHPVIKFDAAAMIQLVNSYNDRSLSKEACDFKLAIKEACKPTHTAAKHFILIQRAFRIAPIDYYHHRMRNSVACLFDSDLNSKRFHCFFEQYRLCHTVGERLYKWFYGEHSAKFIAFNEAHPIITRLLNAEISTIECLSLLDKKRIDLNLIGLTELNDAAMDDKFWYQRIKHDAERLESDRYQLIDHIRSLTLPEHLKSVINTAMDQVKIDLKLTLDDFKQRLDLLAPKIICQHEYQKNIDALNNLLWKLFQSALFNDPIWLESLCAYELFLKQFNETIYNAINDGSIPSKWLLTLAKAIAPIYTEYNKQFIGKQVAFILDGEVNESDLLLVKGFLHRDSFLQIPSFGAINILARILDSGSIKCVKRTVQKSFKDLKQHHKHNTLLYHYLDCSERYVFGHVTDELFNYQADISLVSNKHDLAFIRELFPTLVTTAEERLYRVFRESGQSSGITEGLFNRTVKPLFSNYTFEKFSAICYRHGKLADDESTRKELTGYLLRAETLASFKGVLEALHDINRDFFPVVVRQSTPDNFIELAVTIVSVAYSNFFKPNQGLVSNPKLDIQNLTVLLAPLLEVYLLKQGGIEQAKQLILAKQRVEPRFILNHVFKQLVAFESIFRQSALLKKAFISFVDDLFPNVFKQDAAHQGAWLTVNDYQLMVRINQLFSIRDAKCSFDLLIEDFLTNKRKRTESILIFHLYNLQQSSGHEKTEFIYRLFSNKNPNAKAELKELHSAFVKLPYYDSDRQVETPKLMIMLDLIKDYIQKRNELDIELFAEDMEQSLVSLLKKSNRSIGVKDEYMDLSQYGF